MADLAVPFLNPQDPASVNSYVRPVAPPAVPKPPRQYPTGSASPLPKHHPVRNEIRNKQAAATEDEQPPQQPQQEPDGPHTEQFVKMHPTARLNLHMSQFGNSIANSYTSGGDKATNHIISTYHGKYIQSLPEFPVKFGKEQRVHERPIAGQGGAQEPSAESPGGSTPPESPKPADGPTGPRGPLSPAATAQREGMLPLNEPQQMGRAASMGLGAVEHLASGGSVGGLVAKTAREAFQRRRG